MKFISWNVNGLRAVAGKGFADVFVDLDADFFCLQETKLQAGQIDLEFPGYLSCREEGLLRHRGLYEARTAVRALWHRH